MSQLSLYFKALVSMFIALSWTKWNTRVWGVWGVRWGGWPAMVCIIHRLEPRISPRNHPHSPNSQDPNVLMFLWPRTHQNLEAFVLKTINYLWIFHFIRAPGGKKSFYSNIPKLSCLHYFPHFTTHDGTRSGSVLSIRTCHKSRVAHLIPFSKHLFPLVAEP